MHSNNDHLRCWDMVFFLLLPDFIKTIRFTQPINSYVYSKGLTGQALSVCKVNWVYAKSTNVLENPNLAQLYIIAI